jgi:hypothetical protein
MALPAKPSFKDSPRSGDISVPFVPALPPAPVVQEEPLNVFMDSVMAEQEAGKKALDAFRVRTDAEYEAGKRMLERRAK